MGVPGESVDEISSENIGLGCALEAFSESEEVIRMIDNLKEMFTKPPQERERLSEVAYDRLVYILNNYQEQPHLLDSHVDRILNNLMSIVRHSSTGEELKHEAFKYLYFLMKVRGYKIVVRHLPHEVSDMEPVLQFLEKLDVGDQTYWQSQIVLLLWLSIIVMIPFHMSRLDSFNPNANDENRKTVMQRILDVCKKHTCCNNTQKYSAYLTSHFITRSEIKDIYLGPFLNWAWKQFSNPESSSHVQCGSLTAIAAILKHGKREDLLPHAPVLLKWILGSKYRENKNSLLRKYGVKVLQRIGLTFLKPRVAAWRYQRGSRSLASNLSGGDSKVVRQNSMNIQDLEESDDVEVPEEVEEVIEDLIQGLKDSETIIRWSAAKGVGRVTGRLPKELADDVVGYVLELFNPRESDSGWHGGCLALAELGRRGLLLPQRLPDVVPVVLKALVYDEPRGYVSVGSHIRDAACYVCWSFARAYDVDVLKPYVKDIAGALLVVTVFDREINCRRAASAAFQENVGRQGTFPHGIDILTTADFFAVSVRSNAFLNISVYVAQFEEYTLPLINHLLYRKIDHWDVAIRELSAKALHNLTPLAMNYMSQTVLAHLIEKTNSINLNVRHGAVFAVAEITHALSKIAQEQNNNILKIITPEIMEQIKHLVPTFRERLQFRGMGGELMKQACSHLIEKCSLAKVPFHGQPVLDQWQELLGECLEHEVPNIRSKAASALPYLFAEFYQTVNPSKPSLIAVNVEKQNAVINLYVEKLASNNQIARMGFSQALGLFPKYMLVGKLEVIIPALISSACITSNTKNWAESRRDALKAISAICSTCGVNANSDINSSCYNYLDKIYSCFLEGLREYTQDSRGDVGAWVREAAMVGLQIVTLLVANNCPTYLSMDLVTQIIAGVGQQAVEKIDRTRRQAGKVFSNLIHSDPVVPNIPHHDDLLRIFPRSECDMNINWMAEVDTFPRFTQLLAYPPYTYNIMLGLVNSMGGLTESLVKYSSMSVINFFQNASDGEISRLCSIIIKIYEDNLEDQRVIQALLGFLDQLLSSGVVRQELLNSDSTFALDLLRLTKKTVTCCKEVKKFRGCIDLLCHLIQVNGNISAKSLHLLSIYLCHKFLHIRRRTAASLFEALMMYGDESVIPPENLDTVMSVLSETNWEENVTELKPIRNKLCELMGVNIPKTNIRTT